MTAAPKPRAIKHPGRFAVVAIGLMIVASLGAFVAIESDTNPTQEPGALPSEIASVQPEPETLAKPQQAVVVVLRNDLTGVLVIRGQEIPEDQLSRPTQSSMVFQPGAGKQISRFPAGTNRVEIVYWPAIRSRDDSKSFIYSFRTTA